MPRSSEFPHSMLATFTEEQWVWLGLLAAQKRWAKTEVLRWLVEKTDTTDAREPASTGRTGATVGSKPVSGPQEPSRHPGATTGTSSTTGGTSSSRAAPVRTSGSPSRPSPQEASEMERRAMLKAQRDALARLQVEPNFKKG